jgi:hypothetical protein
VVRGVGVEPLLDRPARHAHRLAVHGRLEGFEVSVVDGARAYERFDLGRDFPREDRREPPFSASSAACCASSASAHLSQASQNASTC